MSRLTLENICYYLDGQEKIQRERGGLSRKTAEFLLLREQMLRLPQEAFEATLKTMQALVEKQLLDLKRDEEKRQKNPQGKEGLALFRQSGSEDLAGSVRAVGKI